MPPWRRRGGGPIRTCCSEHDCARGSLFISLLGHANPATTEYAATRVIPTSRDADERTAATVTMAHSDPSNARGEVRLAPSIQPADITSVMPRRDRTCWPGGRRGGSECGAGRKPGV